MNTFTVKHQNLKAAELGCFLLSSKTPQVATLEIYGYAATDKSGVYRSKQSILNHITLISLNDLADTPYNAWLRMFASKRAEKRKAFKQLQDFRFTQPAFARFIENLLTLMLTLRGERAVEIEITPEDIEEFISLIEDPDLGKLLMQMRLHRLTLEERLKGLEPESVLSLYDPEERLKGLEPEIIEAYLAKIKHNQQH